MKTVVVRYQVRPEQAAENERLIGEVFAQLAREQPAGVQYQALRLEDGVSFVHIATLPQEGPNPLTALAAFQRFVAGIGQRTVEAPVQTPARVVGRYPAV